MSELGFSQMQTLQQRFQEKSDLFIKSPENTDREARDMGQGRRLMKSVQLNTLPAVGTCWGALGDRVDLAPQSV